MITSPPPPTPPPRRSGGESSPIQRFRRGGPPRLPARDSLFATRTGVHTLGYRALLLLAFLLPFDLERRPLLWTSHLIITNLTVALLIVSALALLSILTTAAEAVGGSAGAVLYFSHRRVPLALGVAFLLSCAISTFMAHASTQSGSWFLAVLIGMLLWLALPLWLLENTETRIFRLGTSFVAGAIVASAIGLVEVAVGASFDQHLLSFKFGPSTMGPWLRLSSTFSSANVAAMYFELALPCAVAGLMIAFSRVSWRRLQLAAWLLVVDLLLVAVILTYSRGALLGLLAAALAMAAAGRARWRARTALPWRGLAIAVANVTVVCGFFVVSSSSTELLRFSTQNDRVWYQAAYTGAVPTTLIAGRTRLIPVTVQNQSPLSWNGSSPHTYGLGYHWLYPSSKVERFTNPITWLSADVPPGTRRIVRARVTAPAAPGRYLFSWDMIWKGTTWFAPKTGNYQMVPVTVIEPSGKAASSGPIQHAPPPDIASLPTAPALDRRQIWTAAFKMIEQRPLFGMGSQGVRMNYLTFAPPGQAANPPPHAHNLALELLADWGIIGGGLFVAFLLALWWPFLRGVLRGNITSAWQLAAIGMAAALIGHELVDYFLTKQAMFAVLWILSGLAATMARSDRHPSFENTSTYP